MTEEAKPYQLATITWMEEVCVVDQVLWTLLCALQHCALLYVYDTLCDRLLLVLLFSAASNTSCHALCL